MNKAEIKTIFLTFSLWAFSGFDLILLSFLSVETQKLYFPADDQRFSILAVYGTLSLSLLARVFGGLFFGRLADSHGRKQIVTLCLLSLSVIMLISAYLPSVYTIENSVNGDAALPSTMLSILFVLTRILIGFFVGGIWPTAAVFGFEDIYPRKHSLNIANAISRWSIYKLNVAYFWFEQKNFEICTKRLTHKSALMQVGFFTGYLTLALFLFFFKYNIQSFLYPLFPAPEFEFVTWRSMSLIGFVVGLILFLFYRFSYSESKEWVMWKDVWNQQKDQQKDREAAKKIKKEQNKRLDPGISWLLKDKRYRETLIGCWLIITGLMYMYYSTVVMIPEILSRDTVTDNAGTLILLSMALPAHLILGFFLYGIWQSKCKRIGYKKISWQTTGRRLGFLKFCFNISNDFRETLYNGMSKVLDKSSIHTSTNHNNEFSEEEKVQNLDILAIVVIGSCLIVLGIVGSLVFYMYDPNNNHQFLFFISLTSAIILFANSGWAIVPSMLASRFPVHFRCTGSSLAYNGGLAISFTSPFVIMEFYLQLKSEYVIFIAMILGATCMIIGGMRLMRLPKFTDPMSIPDIKEEKI